MSKGINLKSTPKSVASVGAAIDSSIKPAGLNDMLAMFDPKCHRGEAMAFKPVGREVIPKV